MFGLFSKNLKRNRKAQELREEQWREYWQEQEYWEEQRQNLKPKPVGPRQKRTPGVERTQVTRFRG